MKLFNPNNGTECIVDKAQEPVLLAAGWTKEPTKAKAAPKAKPAPKAEAEETVEAKKPARKPAVRKTIKK